MVHPGFRSLGATLFLLIAFQLLAADEPLQKLLNDARAAFENGKTDEGIAAAGKAIAQFPKDPSGYGLRAQMLSRLGKHKEAIADLDEALKLAPGLAQLHQLRGCEHFRAGHIAESITDFDAYIQAHPDQEPYHWQRGISYFYAGRFADGRKQFELHKSVNPHDVENAAWHYLCVARLEGVEKARAVLIPVDQDARVPMKEIFAMFKGEDTPEDVLKAAAEGNPPAQRLKDNLFYAHLYLGLFFEAAGKNDLAREHIFKAADEFAGEDYMGDVARVHAAILRAKEPAAK